MNVAADIKLAAPAWLDIVDEQEGRALLQTMSPAQLVEAAQDLGDLCDGQMVRMRRGSYRRVFVDGSRASEATFVLKIPMPSGCGENIIDGSWCNIYEAEAAAVDYGEVGGEIAATRLVWTASGIPVVIMEHVAEHDYVSDAIRRAFPMPKWAAAADGNQVGWSDRTGSWLVFDAGCKPTRSWAPKPAWWN